MPELSFHVESAAAVDSSSGPAISLRLLITNGSPKEQVQSIALAVQVQIEPARRRYTDNEKRALSDLFGEPARWSSTMRPLFWATLNATVAGFTSTREFDLTVPPPQSGVGADSYLRAINQGEIPLVLLFSGRVLYLDNSILQMAPIPWTQEASCSIPVLLGRSLVAERRYAERGAPWM